MKKIILTAIAVIAMITCIAQKPEYAGWTESDMKKANTAVNTSLSQEEKNVFLYTNLSRLNGKLFGDTYLKAYLEKNDCDDENIESLYEDLSKIKDLPMLYPAAGLCNAAKAHVDDQGPTGAIGHNSSDGTSFGNRVHSYFNCNGIAENASYGTYTGKDIVMVLLLDEGVPSLGHRKNILNGSYHSLGTSIGNHSAYGTMCVMDFAYCEAGAGNFSYDDNTNNNDNKGGNE